MAPEALVAVIGTVGALVGVVTGGRLNRRAQETAWRREQAERVHAERLALYSGFLGAVRDWRAMALADTVTIVGASRISRDPHADGGETAARAYGLRDEIGLVAGTGSVVEAARLLTISVRLIAEARAEYRDELIPHEIVQRSRDSENHFILIARRDLGMEVDKDVVRLFPTDNRVMPLP